MLDTLLDWAAVFLPTLLSIAGVLVSIKAPHSKHHTAWRVCLVAMGLAISAVTGWQQSRSRSAHAAEVGTLNGKLGTVTDNLKRVQGTLDTSVLRQEYMRGQLDSIGLMVGKLGERTGDAGLGQLANVIGRMAGGAKTKPSGFLQLDTVEAPKQYAEIAAGKQLGFNFRSKNPGPERVYKPFGTTAVYIEEVGPGTDQKVQEQFGQVASKLRDEYVAGKIDAPEVVGVGPAVWGTATTPPLTQQQVDAIFNGTTRIYFVSWLAWRDSDNKPSFVSDCRWLQTPMRIESPQPPIWHFCQR